MQNPNNVVELDIKPKTVTTTYRGHKIILSYVPKEHTWHGTVVIKRTREDKFERVGKRKQDAERLCKQLIDKLED